MNWQLALLALWGAWALVTAAYVAGGALILHERGYLLSGRGRLWAVRAVLAVVACPVFWAWMATEHRGRSWV